MKMKQLVKGVTVVMGAVALIYVAMVAILFAITPQLRPVEEDDEDLSFYDEEID